jgi:hypothetical protein
MLLDPFILGKAIDGMLIKNWLWLMLFFAVEIIANLFMYKRMVYDTKVYTRIYNEIVLQYLSKNTEKETSEKVARTEMANMIIHFFEDAIPYYIMSAMSIVGSLCFICWINWKAGLVVIICLLPIIVIVKKFYPRIDLVTRLSNNHFESKVQILEKGDQNLNKEFFSRRGKLQIYRSTLQGKNWFWLNSTRTVFLVFSLVAFTHDSVGLTQGEAIAMYSYISSFLGSLMSIPVAIEIWSMIRDVSFRLNEKTLN